jgi:hypothetical protein
MPSPHRRIDLDQAGETILGSLFGLQITDRPTPTNAI